MFPTVLGVLGVLDCSILIAHSSLCNELYEYKPNIYK